MVRKCIKTRFLTTPDFKKYIFKGLDSGGQEMHRNTFKKDIFQPLECLKTCFDAFPDHRNEVLKKYIFQRLEWLKTCFDAFPGHQNQGLKKDIFHRLEWLKTCFDAFAHTSRPPESSSRRYSGVAKNVFCCISRPPE